MSTSNKNQAKREFTDGVQGTERANAEGASKVLDMGEKMLRNSLPRVWEEPGYLTGGVRQSATVHLGGNRRSVVRLRGYEDSPVAGGRGQGSTAASEAEIARTYDGVFTHALLVALIGWAAFRLATGFRLFDWFQSLSPFTFGCLLFGLAIAAGFLRRPPSARGR